jgi:hypothetical protein
MIMPAEYEIARTSGRCAVTDRVLQEGEPYYTALFETADTLERRDFSVEAWQAPPQGCFCFWKTRMPVRDRKRQPIVINQEVLTQIFLQLEETESQMKQRFRFILALLLLRKRVLKLENTVREEGVEYWELRLVKEQSIHRLVNPELNAEQIEMLSAQMTQLLTGEPDVIDALDANVADETGVGIGKTGSGEEFSDSAPAASDPDTSQGARAPDESEATRGDT